jgi:DDE superfamily endonuclease
MAWLEAGVEPDAEDGQVQARDRLAAFRGELYRCFTARADALSGLADAVLCAEGPVKTLAGLSLVPGHRRGRGALYDAVNAGQIQIGRLRRAVAALEPGRTSWTAVLDAVRLGPDDDGTEVTAPRSAKWSPG